MKEYVFVSLELGELIRRRRKEKGIRQEELSDDGLISTGTISNIERGACRVSKDKFMHLLRKLELDPGEIGNLAGRRADAAPYDPKLKLTVIEHEMDFIGPEHISGALQTVKIRRDDPLSALFCYLKGKFHEKKERWNNAQKHYLQAIRQTDLLPGARSFNVAAASYHGLSRIHYYLNDIEQALACADKGIEVFVPDGERPYILHHLLTSKVIYLEKLTRYNEALNLLEELWADMNRITSTEARLNMYEMRARILSRLDLYESAVHFALEGLEKARVDRFADCAFELWTTLGSIHVKKGSLVDAELCFQAALKLEKKIKWKKLIVQTYTQLGMLLMKQGKLEEAADKLLDAAALGKKFGDTFKLIEALEALGDCHLCLGETGQARKSFEEALSLIKQHDLLKLKKDVLAKLAKACKQEDPASYRKYIDEFIDVHIEMP